MNQEHKPRTESERRAYQEGILHGVRLSIKRAEVHGLRLNRHTSAINTMRDLEAFVIAFEKLSNETVTEADLPLCIFGPGGKFVTNYTPGKDG